MSSKLDAQRFDEALSDTRSQVEARLDDLLASRTQAPPPLGEAIRYVLLGSGKRLRPTLCLWTHDALGGGNRDACLDAACAIECLHTYSLVHDDLPCMDDDDLRRGRASCHKKFGEATAVLVGDALLTLTFEILACLADRPELDARRVVLVLQTVARAAGTHGLVSGQTLDLQSSELTPTLDTVENIHKYKTAALFAASMDAGAILAGADDAVRARVRLAGERAGCAFQIVDDLLDIEASAEALGKTPGKDVVESKLTHPAVVGPEASRREAARLLADARSVVGEVTNDPLIEALLETLVSRRK
jgi:geranylgeranyl diphosphate synthase type II